MNWDAIIAISECFGVIASLFVAFIALFNSKKLKIKTGKLIYIKIDMIFIYDAKKLSKVLFMDTKNQKMML